MKKQKCLTAKEVDEYRKNFKALIENARRTKEISLTEEQHLGIFCLTDQLFDYITKLENKCKI